MIPNATAAKILSLTDDRDRPLLPRFPGMDDDGSVAAFTADAPLVGSLCGGDTFFGLNCVCAEFGRLSESSRQLVLSLYRAIIERFFIMQSYGPCATRPTFSDLANLCFMTETKSGGCYHVCFEPAILNLRRAFGGSYFKPSVRRVRSMLEKSIWPGAYGHCDFFPITPLAAGSALFCNPAGGNTWQALLGNWLHDMTMRRNSCIAPNCFCTLGPGPNFKFKPIINRLLQVYCNAQAEGWVNDAADFAAWVANQRCTLSCFDEPLGNFSGTFNCWAARLLPSCGNDIRFGNRFYLPALAMALRILSVWNVQSLVRTYVLMCGSIPHRWIRAEKIQPFKWGTNCQEQVLFTTGVARFSRVSFQVTGEHNTTPLRRAAADAYMSIDFCDSTNPNHIIQPPPRCDIHFYPDIPSSGGQIVCSRANAVLFAIWPCFSREQCIKDFVYGAGGSEYPARWAWCEGDVCEAYATGFVGASGLPSDVPGFGKIFRHRITGFGMGYQVAVNASIKTLACAVGSMVADRTSCALTKLPIDQNMAMKYLGEACGGCHADGWDWTFVGDTYFLCGGTLLAWNGGLPRVVCYDMAHGGYYVGRTRGISKTYEYTNAPFSVGPIYVTFGGTFFETYRFRNRAARQVRS